MANSGSAVSATNTVNVNEYLHVIKEGQIKNYIWDVAVSRWVKDPGTVINLSGAQITVDISGDVVWCVGQSGFDVIATVSGDAVTVSGNAVTVSGNWISISGNTVTVSGNWVNTSGNYFASGQAVSVSGNWVSVSGSTVTVSGNWVSVSGSTVTVSGNWVDVSGSWVSVSGSTVTVSGNWVSVSGETVITSVSGNWVSISGETVITSVSGNWVSVSGETVLTSVSGNWVSVSGSTVLTSVSGNWVSVSGSTVLTSISGNAITFGHTPGWVNVATSGALALTYRNDATPRFFEYAEYHATSGAVSSSSPLLVQHISSDSGYVINMYSLHMESSTTTDVFYQPDNPMILVSGDAVKMMWANLDTRDYYARIMTRR